MGCNTRTTHELVITSENHVVEFGSHERRPDFGARTSVRTWYGTHLGTLASDQATCLHPTKRRMERCSVEAPVRVVYVIQQRLHLSRHLDRGALGPGSKAPRISHEATPCVWNKRSATGPGSPFRPSALSRRSNVVNSIDRSIQLTDVGVRRRRLSVAAPGVDWHMIGTSKRVLGHFELENLGRAERI